MLRLTPIEELHSLNLKIVTQVIAGPASHAHPQLPLHALLQDLYSTQGLK